MFMCFLLLFFLKSIGCSYNIALNKTAFQSSTFPRTGNWTADKAVDGDLSTNVLSNACSVTDDNETISFVWWYVDLAERSRVSSVRIVYRNEGPHYTDRLAGFSLFISDNSDLNNGNPILCYKDQSNATRPAADQSIDCDVIGRYVTIYNERLPSHTYPDWYSKRAVLELCEVQVYGCPFGKFGENSCDEECSSGCRDDDCLPNNGSCVSGCRNGWKGQACAECLDGRYGESCNSMCSIGCLNITCNKETGSCDGRCKDNWKEPNCDVCVDGLFGNTCNQNCSIGCNQTMCDKTDGTCSCLEGWSGKKCNVCDNGLYGSTCSQNCSIGCSQATCDRADGSCSCLAGWSGKTCNEFQKLQDKSNGEDVSLLPIILGVVFGLVVVALTATVTIFIRRRRQRKNSQNDRIQEFGSSRPDTEYQHNAVEDGASEEFYQNGQFEDDDDDETTRYANSERFRENKTAPEKLSDEIRRKTNLVIKEEFKTLTLGAMYPKTVGEMEENLKKNRFKFIFPYDHSRVILQNTESDYINANYIKGVERERAYIATQGPKKTTVEDFWSMIWQEGTRTIVMLTNLIEVGKVKCEQYWPDDSQPLTCGYLQIKLQDEQVYSYYTVRKLELHDLETHHLRLVTQLHFNTWPDHGAADPLDLMLFHKKYQSIEKNSDGLPVVHCSAGIGRTGTFIALDALVTATSNGQKVNISDYIENMRKDRMNMIQTKEQYILLHETLLEELDIHNCGISKEDFIQIWKECKSVRAVNMSRIKLDFQNLNSKRPSYVPEIDCKAAPTYKNTIRESDILPMDRFRPFITPKDSNKSDYINAVIVPTYCKTNGFLVTHTPTEDSVYQFWCMIYGHSSSIIVILDEDRNEDVVWFPRDKDDMEVDDFTLHSQNNNFPKAISLTRKGNDETANVQLFMGPECSQNQLPQKVLLLDLIEKVKREHNNSGEDPITVICRDGASLSGLFCIIYNCIESLQLDQEVDVYHTVRQCLKRRPEFCPSYEQYQYCYDVIMEYLESSSIYANQYL